MRRLIVITLPFLALCGTLHASDNELLNAEQRDARLREQKELESRTEALEARQQTTRELLDQQDAYLKALREQIDALKAANGEQGDSEQEESAGGTP
ncbi:hypothetical protein [Alcanivorax sp.]|uniref:hypothetical protein n=1 Tax=Alcanivorax sp. TaxID=1872427 RepID=UPI002438E9D4|nr:hypothetical protein [Alcanivorax sp.]